MKKLLTLIIATLMCIACVFGLTACGSKTNDLDDIIKAGKITVATEATFAPFEYKEGETFKGIDVEIAQAIADYLGVELEINDMEFDAVVTSVQKGQSDLAIAALTINETRQKAIDFSVDYFDAAAQYVVVKSTDTTFDGLTTKAQIDDKLATLSGSAAAQIATTGYFYIKGSADFEFDGFENLTAVSYDSAVLAGQAVQNGQVLLAIVDAEVALQMVKANNSLKAIKVSLSTEKYGIGINKENTALKFVVNKVLGELKSSGKLSQIINSYTSQD